MRLTTSEVDVRLFVYRHFVSKCRAPTILEVAEAFDADRGQIGEFVFSQFDLTCFTDMNTFIPVLTINLENGKVTRHDRLMECQHSS